MHHGADGPDAASRCVPSAAPRPAAEPAAAASPAPPPGPPPPLEHLELSQPELAPAAWRALACGAAPMLGARLASLSLSRCPLPSRDDLLRLGGGGNSSSSSSEGAAAAPFPALRRLSAGVAAEEAPLAAVAALTGLQDLALYHLRCGARAFGPDAPWRLTALTALTRLVLAPVCTFAGGAAVAALRAARRAGRGGGGGESDDMGCLTAGDLWPRMQSYQGPVILRRLPEAHMGAEAPQQL
jgi:hypothetical protein